MLLFLSGCCSFLQLAASTTADFSYLQLLTVVCSMLLFIAACLKLSTVSVVVIPCFMLLFRASATAIA